MELSEDVSNPALLWDGAGGGRGAFSPRTQFSCMGCSGGDSCGGQGSMGEGAGLEKMVATFFGGADFPGSDVEERAA